jgi:hypothetical protein
MGNLPTHGLLEDAFGLTGRRRINTLLPAGLVSLASRLPPGSPTVNELIDRNTAFPYLAPFLRPAARADLREHLQAGGAHAIKGLSTSLRRTKPGPQVLAFCPDCVASDIDEQGMAGWRRSHQMPGVFVCHAHGTPLRTIGVKIGSIVELICCPSDPDSGEPLECPLGASDALELAGLTAKLVSGAAEIKTSNEVRERAQGYLAPSGTAGSPRKPRPTRERPDSPIWCGGFGDPAWCPGGRYLVGTASDETRSPPRLGAFKLLPACAPL